MATMRPTPRNELLGLLSDAYKWMQSPERAQQMQGFAGLLGTTGVPQTIERMAYGEPLTNIGRANVPLLKPETADALMTVAPFAPKGMKMIRATEGLPVGMSIKDVGKGIVKEVPKKSSLLDMTRTPSEAEIKKMSREDLIQWLQNNDPDGQYMDPTPNPSISMYRTGKGYAVENADSGDVFEFKDFNEAQKEFNSMRFSHAEFPPMTLQEAQESAINYLRESAQPAEGAKVIPLKKPKAKLNAPQQAALDLAQQRAALPVSEGGLGLPANNTPEMRAAAMGFDKDIYHGSQNEISSIDFSRAGQNTGNPNATLGFFTTPNPQEGSRYATLHGNQINANVMPLRAKSSNSYEMPYKELDDMAMSPYNLMMADPNFNPNAIVKFGDMAAQKAAAERLQKYKKAASEQSLQRKKELMQEGFDSATVLPGKSMEEFIVFNPDIIRSRFAAFDPFRRDVATATAMGVALPDLLAAELPEEELKRSQSSGLLFP